MDSELLATCVSIEESSPKHNKSIDGGAMQITICQLSVDYYPFHYAGKHCAHAGPPSPELSYVDFIRSSLGNT